jgi:MaoC like domain
VLDETVSSWPIIDFARRFDPQPMHVDRELAAATRFGGHRRRLALGRALRRLNRFAPQRVRLTVSNERTRTR